MATLHGEQHFPEATHDKRHDVERQKMQCTEQETVPYTVYVVATKCPNNSTAPAIQLTARCREHFIGLESQVPHAVEHGRECGKPYGDHDALQIHTVAHVSR